jgi:nucleoside-diphosphate-sugar epimerase
MLLNRNVVVYGPNHYRDYMHVSDAVRAIETVSLSSEQVPMVEIGTGEPVITKDLIKKLSELIKHSGKIKLLDSSQINIVSYVADPTLAKEKFGFVCQKDFDVELEGLVRKRRKELR